MTPFFMQTLVMTGLFFTSITDGFIFGQMSGLIDEIMKPESPLKFTNDEISWIASSIFISSFIGSAVVAFITDMIGRKYAATLFTSPILINWMMLYYGESFIVFILSRVIVGLCFGSAFVITTIATAEYTSPKNRALCFSIVVAVGPALGTGIGHVLGTIMNWRNVALIGIIPTLLAAIIPLFWVESPSWLASKGRYEECEDAFRALHGTETVSEKELSLLVKLEKSRQTETKIKRTLFFDALRQKRFYNIFVLSMTIGIYFPVTGRAFLPIFAITIVKEITNSSDVVLFTFLLEVLTILGTVLSFIFIKKFNMRPLLLILGTLSCLSLILLSATLHFKPGDNWYMSWVNVSLLSLYFVFVNAGPYPVILGVSGEIYPLHIKSLCVLFFGSLSGMLMFLSVKTASWVFSVMGYHGAFLFYMIISLICLFIFWWKLPETKGRTLQEIELYFKNNTFENIDDLLSDQIKPLQV